MVKRELPAHARLLLVVFAKCVPSYLLLLFAAPHVRRILLLLQNGRLKIVYLCVMHLDSWHMHSDSPPMIMMKQDHIMLLSVQLRCLSRNFVRRMFLLPLLWLILLSREQKDFLYVLQVLKHQEN